MLRSTTEVILNV